MLKDMHERKVGEHVELRHNFHYKDDPDAGLSFEVDKEGNLITDNDLALMNYARCIDKSNPLKIVDDGIHELRWGYTEPAYGTCEFCDTEVVLDDPLDNVCEGCGAIYNRSGSHVTCLARDIDYLDAGERYEED